MEQAKLVSKKGLVVALGDFNLDVQRLDDPDYYLKPVSDQYQLDLGEGGLEIIDFGITHPKNKSSIDHGFCNKPETIQRYGTLPIDQIYSDHSLIYVELEA